MDLFHPFITIILIYDIYLSVILVIRAIATPILIQLGFVSKICHVRAGNEKDWP